jgi:hypothetical protein
MKFLENLKKYQTAILLSLFVMLLFRTCGTASEITKLRKEYESQNTILKSLPTKTDIKIEGLKVEKRMIQATDRKLLDVQRQTEIEKEINQLEGK